jgi:hypothetical protein
MIQIEIEDKVVEVNPYLTIEQYQNLKRNMETYKDDPTAVLSLYTNIPVRKLKNLPFEQVKFVQEYITTQFTDKSISDELHNVFTHNGVEYGLENNWQKLAWGAWVDLEVFSSEDIEENIHLLMSVLYRPIKERKKNKYVLEAYDADTIEERANEFLILPVNYWFGVSVFFFITVNLYMKDIESSLTMKNRLNLMIMKGWTILPKWVKRKLPLDSILTLPTNLQGKTLPNFSR